MRNMFRILTSLVMACCLLGVSALALAEGDIASMPNPMQEATAEEVNAALGFEVTLPEEAADVQYFLYALEDTVLGAEIQYNVGETAYVFRGEPGEEATDISGMYIEFAAEEEVVEESITAAVKLNEGAEGVFMWFDAELGMNYCLTMMDGASVDALAEMVDVILTATMEAVE